MTNYVSQYPPAHSNTYVKATSNYASRLPYYATDPAKNLVGGTDYNGWDSASLSITNQRFHVDLGVAKIIKRIYYENRHTSGTNTNGGAKTFTIWGSNNAAAFTELTYGTDTNWTQITASQATFDEHVAADQADPKYITLTNTTPYQYYAIKIADNWGGTAVIGLRRVVLQEGTEILAVLQVTRTSVYKVLGVEADVISAISGVSNQ